ncbi:Asp-tRNA(Asn)/Glu-tRNA(Gln) amidotransferase subunit GatC [bacterium]|nr:Asp-tRNA(Asn)/Glu-tRNA(Gln) amidotransferase subunit GatC [bacterium]
MITKEEVKHIAKLARLHMDSEEEEKFTKELSVIIDYIEKLKEVDVSAIPPTSHPFEVENIVREDTEEKSKPELVAKLIQAAPAREKAYIKVKPILKWSK